MQVWYCVTAKFRDLVVRDEYVEWLKEHLQGLIEGGALSARAVVLDGDEIAVQSQYVFPSREIFDRYVNLHAPALRAEGLKYFPPERGVTFARQVGEIRHSLGPGPQRPGS